MEEGQDYILDQAGTVATRSFDKPILPWHKRLINEVSQEWCETTGLPMDVEYGWNEEKVKCANCDFIGEECFRHQ